MAHMPPPPLDNVYIKIILYVRNKKTQDLIDTPKLGSAKLEESTCLRVEHKSETKVKKFM